MNLSMKTEVDFYGLKFSDKGIALTEHKIKALKEATTPKTASELRSFLGLATYCSRYIPNLASISDKLWKLTRNKVKWNWTAEHQKQFDQVKTTIIENALGYFNKDWTTYLEVDASPVGTGAVLFQEDPQDSEDKKIIMFWSQSFTDIEERYSQIEKEALAIVLGCEKFKIYLVGKPFFLITDNKAMELILKNPKSKPPARILRWNLRLMEYHHDIIHRPGKTNIADFLSRNPIKSNLNNKITGMAEEFVNFIEYTTKPSAMKIEDIIVATKADKTIQMVIKCLQKNDFTNDKNILSYKNIKDELSVTNQGILLRDARIVIPENLRNKATQLAHEGHQGLIKTKKLLRGKIWFPGIDKNVENLIDNCSICQLNNNGNRREELNMSKFPDLPWMHLEMDLFGPLPNNNELLVITDLHSRFPYEAEVKTSSSKYIYQFWMIYFH